MKKENLDLRSRYSKNVIKDALKKLLETKSITKISVTELCALAKINRGTFYNHFNDIIDVYESIQVDFYNYIIEKLETKSVTSIDGQYFKQILLFVFEFPTIVKIILEDSRSQNKLLSKLIDYTKEKYLSDFTTMFPYLSEDEINHLSTYTINGTLSFMIEYAKNPDPSKLDYMTNLIIKMNQGAVKEFLAVIQKDK